jgi:hypothetical protein
MTLSNAFRALGLCAGFVVLAGCGISATPSAAWQSPGQMPPQTVRPDRSPSWMAPDAKKSDLLYVSDVGTDDVYVYSYPQGKLKGKLTGFVRPSGLCVDKSGNIFITDLFANRILEYGHGGTKRIATLTDPSEDPGDCAVDPTTGNLAVTNVSTSYSGPGDVLVYANARGTPKSYKDSEVVYYEFCGYDNRGNLYVDGMNSDGFAFAELPSGAGSLEKVTLNESISYAGAVQSVGSDVAVGDYESNLIYQFSISGVTGKEVSVTHLHKSSFAIGFWIQGSTVVGPNDDSANLMFWRYPSGGSPTKTISGLRQPWGATVSLAP